MLFAACGGVDPKPGGGGRREGPSNAPRGLAADGGVGAAGATEVTWAAATGAIGDAAGAGVGVGAAVSMVGTNKAGPFPVVL